jgi:hypothetical protein
MDNSDVESIITECLEAMKTASRDRYDSEEADKTAALFLVAQMKLSFLVEEIEIKTKGSKNDISRVEAEKYFEYKNDNSDKKVTENMIVNSVAKDPDVVQSKQDFIRQEATLKKWNYILNILKDGHVYFRNIGKNKTWNE